MDIQNNSRLFVQSIKMTKNHESIILITDPTGTVGNAVVKQLASSDQNVIRVAVDTKNKVDKLKHASQSWS